MQLCPSMMCANFGQLKKEVENLEKAQIDRYHLDVMDGSYVPNLAMGLEDIKMIRKLTKRELDVHLMVNDPEPLIPIFAKSGIDNIYFHPETIVIPSSFIQKIHYLGMKAGIVLNPCTTIESMYELFSYADYVMVMTVHPGFSGQPFLEETIDKIKRLGQLKAQEKFELAVDGAISERRINDLLKLNVDSFVLGTSGLFNREEAYDTIIQRLRKLS